MARKRSTQVDIIFEYLQHHIATASMAAKDTGIPQKNICRVKRKLEKANRLWEIKHGKCKVTGYMAMYLTTNKELLPPEIEFQLQLF